MSVVGAVDIGGTKIAVGGVRDDGTILYRCECPTDANRGFPDAMRRVRRMLHEVVDACGALEGIGIASPGPLDPFTATLGEIGTLPGWQGGNLVDEVRREFNLKVAIENDADAASLAEFYWGSAGTSGSFIYITISTGIGGGIVLNGEIYRGVRGSHPELGHQIIDSSGPLCYCGANGCWEALASGTAMSTWVREAADDSPALDAAAICERARSGDDLALRAVRREGYYLGLGLANIVTMFTPEVIALGGGVMKSSELFFEEATKTVRRLCSQVPAEETRIVLASLGADAGLLGAAQSWLLRSGSQKASRVI